MAKPNKLTAAEYTNLIDRQLAEGYEALSLAECRLLDQYVRNFAMKKFTLAVKHLPRLHREYLMLMVRCHYGTLETTDYLSALRCFPDQAE